MAPTTAPLPNAPGAFPVGIPAEAGTNSLWARVSNWASDNKGVVYTLAGITLVVGAGGAVYYFSNADARAEAGAADSAANKRKRQRERKRAKDRADRDPPAETSAAPDTARHATEPKKASVAPAEDELPDVDASSVGALSQEVSWPSPPGHAAGRAD